MAMELVVTDRLPALRSFRTPFWFMTLQGGEFGTPVEHNVGVLSN